jgi:hypothetical protein
VRRHGILITLVASQAVVAALAALFYTRLRPAVLSAFDEFGTPMPAATAVALSRWFLPGAVALGLVLAVVAAAAPMRRQQRYGALSAGVVISGAALVFAALAAFAPLFQPR